MLPISKLRRADVEARIEALIAFLDHLDGDCDFEDCGDQEPSIGSPAVLVGGRLLNDVEADMSDDEPSLGWANPMGLRVHIPQEARQMMPDIDGPEDPSDWGFNGTGNRLARRLLHQFNPKNKI